MEGTLGAKTSEHSNQARFILEKCDGTLKIENKKKKIMIDELTRRGYDSDPVKAWNKSQAVHEEEKEGEDEDDNEPKEKDDGKGPDYDYLLGMPMWDLTQEKKDKIYKQRDTKNTELKKLKATTINTMWTKDLDEFIAKLDEVEKQEKKEINETELSSDNNIVKLPGGMMTCFLCLDVEPTTSLATVVADIATIHNTVEDLYMRQLKGDNFQMVRILHLICDFPGTIPNTL